MVYSFIAVLVLTTSLVSREESVLKDIKPDELHVKLQNPTFLEEAQLIDVREPDEVYAHPLFLHF